MFDALISKYASVAFMVIGGGLSVIALRAVKRWVFWMLLLLAIPCLLIAGAIYWYVSQPSFGGPSYSHARFQSALKVGMTESEVWETVEKYYPNRDAHRPTVLQNGSERVGIVMPPDDSDPSGKMIHLRFEDGRVAEVTGR